MNLWLIGHRGTGSDSYNAPLYHGLRWMENTLGSFRHAFSQGANMVEFDVQLAKDLQPVIFHDFYVCKQDTPYMVSELTYLELSELVLNGRLPEGSMAQPYQSRGKGQCPPCETGPLSDHLMKDAVPTLKGLLQASDLEPSYNIEIKFPDRDMIDRYGMKTPVPVDKYCEVILDTVKRYASPRANVIFSSFHPDVCRWVRKHTGHKVYLLTEARNMPSQREPRTDSLAEAFAFAKTAALHGIVADAEGLLKEHDHRLSLAIRSAGLSLWTYGKENTSRDLVDRQLRLGVDGIITDDLPLIQDEPVTFKEDL